MGKADKRQRDPRAHYRAVNEYSTLNHDMLEGLKTGAMWEKYRLAIGGRVAPAELTPCPDNKEPRGKPRGI